MDNFENLDEIDKFLNTYTYTTGWQKLAQEAVENPNSSTIFKEIKLIV